MAGVIVFFEQFLLTLHPVFVLCTRTVCAFGSATTKTLRYILLIS